MVTEATPEPRRCQDIMYGRNPPHHAQQMSNPHAPPPAAGRVGYFLGDEGYISAAVALRPPVRGGPVWRELQHPLIPTGVFVAFSFVRSRHYTLTPGRTVDHASDLAYPDSCLDDFCSSMCSPSIANACRLAPNCVPAACGMQDPTQLDPLARTLVVLLSKYSGVTTEAKLLSDDNKINPDYYVDSINDFFP